MKNFFYIITRDKQIFEIEDTGNRFQGSMELWQKGGLIMFANLGININAVDVSKILDKDQYENFIETTQPLSFIKNGTWYDGKEKSKILRYEKWRQLELDEKKKRMLIENKDNGMTKQELKEWFQKNKPETIKEFINKIQIPKNYV